MLDVSKVVGDDFFKKYPFTGDTKPMHPDVF